MPAWSEFLYCPEQSLELLTQSSLKTLLLSVGLTPTRIMHVPGSRLAASCLPCVWGTDSR